MVEGGAKIAGGAPGAPGDGCCGDELHATSAATSNTRKRAQ